MIKKIFNFFQETKVELTKVSWPTKLELIDSTFAIIFSTFVMALFIGIIDFLMSTFLKVIISK